jgi:hypothetical protein
MRRRPMRNSEVIHVLIDDKLRILDAVKQAWGDQVTTVCPRQGNFANDPQIVAAFPAADLTIERIGDVIERGFVDFMEKLQRTASYGLDSKHSEVK